jgi:hypothetical protein
VNLSNGNSASIAVETNGKGYIGFLVELPGSFVRGRSETELLLKVPREARSYLEWLKAPLALGIQGRVVERHRSRLTIEDADSEILLVADKGPVGQDEFRRLITIVGLSGRTFISLYESSRFKDWVDKSRSRQTFYGETPSTIQATFDHVESVQHYYLSRIGLAVDRERPFSDVREAGLSKIRKLFDGQGNSRVYLADGEHWTIKKVLRRFVWHDRIHGKAISRILEAQKHLGLIESYKDPFCFGL